MIQKTVRDGEQCPAFYRIAWYDYMRRRAVCYPIGIRWIAWAVRYLWMLTYKQTRPDAWERACADAAAKLRDEYSAKRERDLKECRQWRDMAMKASFEAGEYLARLETATGLSRDAKIIEKQVNVGDTVYVGGRKATVLPAGESGEVVILNPMESDGADCA